MSDLTKLKAKEFSRRIDNCDLDIEERTEIDRRLEWLEKCEAFLKRLYPYMEALNHFHLPDKSIMYASELWDLLYADGAAHEAGEEDE